MTATVLAFAPTFAECERIIEANLRSFVDVGAALIRIRDGKLYRATYPTFEAYCAARWGFTRTWAYDLISSASTVKALSGIPDIPIPATQSQADELRGLPAEVAAEVMTEAADSGKLTAASIREARERIAPTVTVTTTTTESHEVDLTTGEATPVPVPQPKADRRKPLADGFRDASLDLAKLITRLENLAADDRLPKNRNEVARYANDLIRARDALSGVIDQMSQQKGTAA